MANGIVPVTKQKIPSVIGIDANSIIVIGNTARSLGLEGRTNTYHFKPELGKLQDDAQYKSRTNKAGREIPAKAKPYWVRHPTTSATKNYSTLEAAREFLGKLVPKTDTSPQQLIVGEPILDDAWRENYRRNIRQILTTLGYGDSIFFPEPFAVYQYYRHIERIIEDKDQQQTVFVVDFGGGTFDCCVIRTTKAGDLAKGGAHSLPLGVQSRLKAGEAVDIELLRLVHERAKAKGIVFKDDPLERAKKSAQPLWIIENTKIRLSETITKTGVSNEDEKALQQISEPVLLPRGSFHMSEDIDVNLTAADLRKVVLQLWNREWGRTLIKCHRESGKKLGEDIKHYDIVLVAGGSAHLPFVESLIKKTIPNQLANTKIIIGNLAGAAVAQGIAVECREQSKKHPGLVNERLRSCLLNDLYIATGRRQNDESIPKVRLSDSVDNNNDGLVYRSPGLLEESNINCRLELRYKPNGVLYYWFRGAPTSRDFSINANSVRVRIPGNAAVDRKVGLTLKIESDGTVTPHFTFSRRGISLQKVAGQPFNLGEDRLDGNILLGIDIGTCNSYVAKYIVPEKGIEQASYPEYEITRDTSARLIKLEKRCQELRDNGVLNHDNLIRHAKANELDFVFHSNKLEGNKLSRGETKGTLEETKVRRWSKDELEATNLRDAYGWALEEHKGCVESFSAFVRSTNKILLEGIEENAGSFRTKGVEIGGVDYKPPPWGSVDDFMRKLGAEIVEDKQKTSGLELAVRAHTKFVAIHPFVDGNGRTARIIIAAVLLSYDLPVLVLNADDKERYLDALAYSNGGSLDSLLSLYMEIMDETLNTLEHSKKTGVATVTEETIGQKERTSSHEGQKDTGREIKNRSPETDKKNGEGSRAKRSIIPDGAKSRKRLVSVLTKKSKARKQAQKVTYAAWKNAFEMFRSEVSSYVCELDNLDVFRDAGYEVRFSEYDMVTEDRFDQFWTRRDQSHTWFCSVTICNALECYGLMMQFGHCSPAMQSLEPATAPVTCLLAIGGERTGTWLPVREEPIKLKEIGYANGRLIYMDYEGKIINHDVNYVLDELIADLIGE